MYYFRLAEHVSSLYPRRELRSQQPACEEEAVFSASSEERERPFKASKLHNSITFFFTKSKIMFLCFL